MLESDTGLGFIDFTLNHYSVPQWPLLKLLTLTTTLHLGTKAELCAEAQRDKTHTAWPMCKEWRFELQAAIKLLPAVSDAIAILRSLSSWRHSHAHPPWENNLSNRSKTPAFPSCPYYPVPCPIHLTGNPIFISSRLIPQLMSGSVLNTYTLVSCYWTFTMWLAPWGLIL